ncbi:superoxide dismutase family protein [Streptomyces sp. NPDC001817]|uniref:superoxide dismutase family protein n=1 Tax=Streptomyces sp. NPDC001817 TaxID=3154398 RepID=UPI003332DF8D
MVAAIYAGTLAAALFATGSGSTAHGSWLETSGVFSVPSTSSTSKAVAYDRDLVPAGARIKVRQFTSANGATTVELRVTGVKPNHLFGVHVHQKACAADPKAAGMHYQNAPGTDAAHTTKDNEIWLDFKSSARGTGSAVAKHSWAFRKGEAGSVVIHSEPGTKGARVACFSVPFRGTS